MASLLGVNVDRTISLTFVIGASLAAVAGLMVTLYYGNIDFYMGFTAGIKAFTAAVLGDVAGLESLLASDVELVSDGGGQVSAARRPVLGSRKVAAFLVGIAKRADPQAEVLLEEVNGVPSLLLVRDGTVTSVVGGGGLLFAVIVIVAVTALASWRLGRYDIRAAE